MIKQKIAENLLALRSKAGLSQAKVAEKCGISLTAYNYYEKGQRAPDAEVLAKLAEIFKTSIDTLATGDATLPDAGLHLNANIKGMLQNIIMALEETLDANDLEMDAAKKVEMIFYLYDLNAKEQASKQRIIENTSNVVRLMAG